MTLKLSDLKWWRVVVLAVLVTIANFVIVIAVITGYGAVLGFQTRGAPDPAKIAQFASQSAGLIGAVTLLVLTFLAAAWLARRPNVAGPVNGLAVGVLAGLLSLIGSSLDLGAIMAALLAVLAGWLGGGLGRKT